MNNRESDRPNLLGESNLSNLLHGRKIGWDIRDESNRPIDCMNCMGACCTKSHVLSLTSPEAAQMKSVGTKMELYRPKRREPKPPKGREFYELQSDCGNLDSEGKCTIYDQRPQICREVPVAGETCIISRYDNGYKDQSKYPTPPQGNF